jgi:hypothetical protein
VTSTASVYTLFPVGIHTFCRFYAAGARPFVCETCGGYWPTLDAALAVPCKVAA